jgi:ATP-dependent DNA helicase HFM1/MER3
MEWSRAFEPFGIVVIEATGDSDMNHSLQRLVKANLIITTPEKLDSMTRGVLKNHPFLLGSMQLLLIDEVHHLADDRGAVLGNLSFLSNVIIPETFLTEAVVVRMKMLNESLYRSRGDQAITRMRIIALSATLPNIDDIGEWLGCKGDAVHYFDETYRPVPLTVHTLSFGMYGKNQYLYDRVLNSRIADVVKQYADYQPTLIFCGSKNNCELVADGLASKLHMPRSFIYPDRDVVASIQNHTLRGLVSRGIGFHHAGLSPQDKEIIEFLYTKRCILALTATTTLAFGVNLPAHLVIVKGTSQYRRGEGYVRMNRSLVLQMLGRAGRQGMDTHGVAVILTGDEDKNYFKSLTMDVVESTLPSHLIETLCAEISQQVIKDVADALIWAKKTYWYIRVHRNKLFYGYEDAKDDHQLEQRLLESCQLAIRQLAEADIVGYSEVDCSVSPNFEAVLMSRALIKFKTMSIIMRISATADLSLLIKEVFSLQHDIVNHFNLTKDTHVCL